MPRAGDGAEALGELVKKLKASLKSKDALIKQLKAVSSVLDKAPQDVGALGSAKDELASILVAQGLLQHSDKDVRLYAAFCQAHLLRIFAPESPYDEEAIQTVFGVLLWSIQRLQQHNAPTFELALSTLQVVSQTKSYFLLLDLGREDLVLKWAKGLLECVNERNLELVEEYVVEVVATTLEEGEVSNDMLELLLSFLIDPCSSSNPAGASVVRGVLQRVERHVKPALQTYLTRLIDNAADVKSDLHDQLYKIVYELYRCMPQVLLPVIPHISGELQSDDEERRLDAVALLGRMFCLPGVGLAAEYADVLDDFVRRYHDQKVGVRLAMLKLTSSLMASAKSQDVQKKVLDAAADRLQDFDDKVRCAAAHAVCEASAARPAAVPEAALEAVSVRLRDTKPAVRMAAAVALLVAFRQRVQRQESGAVDAAGAKAHEASDLDEDAEGSDEDAPQPQANGTQSEQAQQQQGQHYQLCWIPMRIFLCAPADPVLRQALLEVTAKEGLLPAGLPAAAAARWWAHMFGHAQPRERDALLALVKSKAKLQRDLLTLLELRRTMSSREEEDREEASAAMRKWAEVVAAQLPDPHKAEENLQKLLAVKDNKVVVGLQAALALTATPEASSKARKDALARVGSKSPLADFISSTCMRALPSWLTLQHVHGLLGLALGQQEAGRDVEDEEEQLEAMQAAGAMLRGLAKHAPTLLVGSVPQLIQLLQSSHPEQCTLGAQLLAGAGQVLRSFRVGVASSSPGGRPGSSPGNGAEAAAGEAGAQQGQQAQLLELLPVLRQLAMEGPPMAAKAAVLAIGALYDEGRMQEELGSLCDELVQQLTPTNTNHEHTPARLQAVSSIGRLAPEAFSRHVQQLLQYVTEDYLNADLDTAPGPSSVDQSPPSGQPETWGHPGRGMLLKAQAIKALARGFVTDKDKALVPVPSMRAVVDYVAVLESLVEPEGDHPCVVDASPLDAGYLRLAAASALLRLARRHDVRIGTSSYVGLALVMQDSVAEVRATFAVKVSKLLRFFQARRDTHQLAAKYAAMLPLAAVDPTRENKVAAAHLLRDFVVKRRQLAQQIITKAASEKDTPGGGSTLQEQPEMMMPYLLHLLAHHPDFPKAETEEDTDIYDPFQVMLQFALQPLLSPVAGYSEAGAMLPAILKFMRYIKHTEDAMEDEPCTIQLHTLCDIATALARAITAELQSGAKGGAAEAAAAASRAGDYPGAVILPKTLFKRAEGAGKGEKPASFLPPNFEVHLDPEPPMPLVPTTKATAATQTKAAGGKPRSRRAAAAGDADKKGSSKKEGGKARAQRAKAGAAASEEKWDSESEDEGAGKRKRAPKRAGSGAPKAKRRQSSKQQHGASDESDGEQLSDSSLGASDSMDTDIPIPAAAGTSSRLASAARAAAAKAATAQPAVPTPSPPPARRGRGKAHAEAGGAGPARDAQTKLTSFTAADASSPGPRADGSTRRRAAADQARRATSEQQQAEETEQREEEQRGEEEEEEEQQGGTAAAPGRGGGRKQTAKAAGGAGPSAAAAEAHDGEEASPSSHGARANGVAGGAKGGSKAAAAKRRAGGAKEAAQPSGASPSKRARRHDTGKGKATEADTAADELPVDDSSAGKDQRKAPAARKGTAGKEAAAAAGKKVPAAKAEPTRRARSAGKA